MDNHIHFVDHQTILYPAGNYLVLHNVDSATQKFISIMHQESVISGDASEKNVTRFMAAIQESEEKARREQRLPKGYSVNSMQISPDRNLVALTHFSNCTSLENEENTDVAVIQIIDIKKMRQTSILRTSEKTVRQKDS